MSGIFLDTNIWVRYLVEDSGVAYEAAVALVNSIQNGEERAYSSTVVMMEVAFVLSRLYEVSSNDVQKALEAILDVRGLILIEQTDFPKALELHKKTGVKIADCLIATQILPGVRLATFDKEFKKIPGIEILTPEV